MKRVRGRQWFYATGKIATAEGKDRAPRFLPPENSIRAPGEERTVLTMKMKTALITIGLAAALCAPWQNSFADDTSGHATHKEKTFIKTAADGGMTEVKLGEIAQQNGQRDDIKDFGKQMVDDHTKINDNLKEVASKMNVEVPSTISAKHQAVVDRLSKLHGDAFDKAYTKEMIKDHKKDIAEFEEAAKEVKNEDLKSFIQNSTEMMKGHLEKIEKISKAE